MHIKVPTAGLQYGYCVSEQGHAIIVTFMSSIIVLHSRGQQFFYFCPGDTEPKIPFFFFFILFSLLYK